MRLMQVEGCRDNRITTALSRGWEGAGLPAATFQSLPFPTFRLLIVSYSKNIDGQVTKVLT